MITTETTNPPSTPKHAKEPQQGTMTNKTAVEALTGHEDSQQTGQTVTQNEKQKTESLQQTQSK